MDKLLVSLNFLAHCPSLRQMATKWGMPHCSISTLCQHPVVSALREIFVGNAYTRNIVWSKEEDQQVSVMDEFKRRLQLPSYIGAVDCSLIPQRKPTKEQANQDSDSYYDLCHAKLRHPMPLELVVWQRPPALHVKGSSC
jgi:hypothetical protein